MRRNKTRFMNRILSTFFCGHMLSEEEDKELGGQHLRRRDRPCSTPTKSRNKNPFSNQGLDKFSSLLSDLEVRKQKIYSQLGSENVSLIQFAYSGNNRVRPLVLRSKDVTLVAASCHPDKNKNSHMPAYNRISDAPPIRLARTEQVASWNFWANGGRRSRGCHLPIVTILILLSLAFFGRLIAVLCVSTCWYLLPLCSHQERVNDVIHERTNSELIIRDGLDAIRFDNKSPKQVKRYRSFC